MNPDSQRLEADRFQLHESKGELTEGRGRLKIFLGYAPGVGKTFSMLEAAQRLDKKGKQSILVCIETHGQRDLDEKLMGFEICPIRMIKRGSDTFNEPDLDRILLIHPQFVLIDNLAHTNQPGIRHPRRYQDVEELLAAGINVYTTLNIYQLESLNDVVNQITGVRVRDTVPDQVFDNANDIELIDIPPGELIQRLRDRKIIIPEFSAVEVENFFRQGNLIALRELAMRRAAERIDDQMRTYMQMKAIPGPWPAGERILVSLSSHPLGERLVRAGKKLADELKTEWYVLFVETPGHLGMPPGNRSRMENNLALAEQLGAHVFTVSGNSVVEEVLRFSQQHNITKIIAGKPKRSRWQEFFKPSVIEEILRNSSRIDVFVVSEDRGTLEHIQDKSWLPHRPLVRYLGSLGLVGIASGLCLLLHPIFDPANLVMVYLAAVVLAAVFLGRGPSMLASFLSVLVFDFLIINPRFSFAVEDTQYLITFASFLIIGLIISNSAQLLRGQVHALQLRERGMQQLNRFSQELTGAVSLDQVLKITLKNLGNVFAGEIGIFLPVENHLCLKSATEKFILNESESAAAEWAFKNARVAGKGTDTNSTVQSHYLPLKTLHGVNGILGIQSPQIQDYLTQDKRNVLSGLINLVALAIERAKFAEDAMQAETLRAAERLQSALLNSISHQLRTPLATITGVLTSLSESEKAGSENGTLPPDVREELILSATQQADTLNRLVENLLAMTRLEAGIIQVNCQPGDVQDLIGAVISQVSKPLSSRNVILDIPADIPAVMMDAVLTGQVLVNLLENSCKFSEPGSSVYITVREKEGKVEISVSDEGPGIPAEDLPHIFEKFYRGKKTTHAPGTGLGLSICKGIIEAQGGEIRAENHPEKGVSLAFELPVYDDSGEEKR